MATGISFPVRVSPSGGLSFSSGSEQDENIITLALLDDDTDHAFHQGEGLGVDMVFDVNDPLARAGILGKLRAVFTRFERLKRFQLKEDTIVWKDGEEGEQILEFKYISLESDDEQLFRRKFSSAQDGAGGNQSSNG